MTEWFARCSECANMAPTKMHDGFTIRSKDRPDAICSKHHRGMSVVQFDPRFHPSPANRAKPDGV